MFLLFFPLGYLQKIGYREATASQKRPAIGPDAFCGLPVSPRAALPFTLVTTRVVYRKPTAAACSRLASEFSHLRFEEAPCPCCGADAGDRLGLLFLRRPCGRLPLLPPRPQGPSPFWKLTEARSDSLRAAARAPAPRSHGLHRRLAGELLRLRQAYRARLAHLPGARPNRCLNALFGWMLAPCLNLVHHAFCLGVFFCLRYRIREM